MPADASTDPLLPDLTRGIYRRLYSGALTGRRINAVNEFSELLLWRIHMIADDFGRFKADAEILKSQAFPLRKTATVPKVRKGRDALQEARLIDLYAVKGETYGVVLDFESMQPAGRSGRRIPRNPAPPKSSDTKGLESGGIRGDPGGSGGHHHHHQDQDHDQDHQEDERVVAAPLWTEADILRIYTLYPRKQKRVPAVKAIGMALERIAKAKGSEPVEPLAEATTAFRDSPAGQKPPKGGKDYRPHPATWFNSESYLDDRETWQRPNGQEGGTSERTQADRRRAEKQAREYGEKPRL